jgi:hypothetical protein
MDKVITSLLSNGNYWVGFRGIGEPTFFIYGQLENLQEIQKITGGRIREDGTKSSGRKHKPWDPYILEPDGWEMIVELLAQKLNRMPDWHGKLSYLYSMLRYLDAHNQYRKA